MPRVTVVIPTYNYEAYLAEAVESALGQTCTDREVLVVDDGSTDRTPEILERYQGLIRVIRQEHGGAPSALNTGIRHAEGEWLAWLSSDDVFQPDKLALQLAYAEADPECAVIYTDWYAMDRHGRAQHRLDSPGFPEQAQLVERLFEGCVINGSTTLVHRSCFEQAGLFDEELLQAHDWDMWLRLARDFRFGHLPLPLTGYRWHGANLSAGPDALAYDSRVLAKARAYYRGRGGAPCVS